MSSYFVLKLSLKEFEAATVNWQLFSVSTSLAFRDLWLTSSLLVCQLNCSSHGECDAYTRRCVCHPFWMENFIRSQLGDAESNCGKRRSLRSRHTLCESASPVEILQGCFFHTFLCLSFLLPRVERALRHNSVLYDCGRNSDSCLGDGVLLQEVSMLNGVKDFAE